MHITVTYLTATINRKTRKGEPETGTDRSSQTRQTPQVDGYQHGFGLPRSCGSGLWMVLEPNRTVYLVQTRTAGGLPGPVANTSSDGAFTRHKVMDVNMQRDPSRGQREACSSPSEGMRFRQSSQSHPEHPGVSDGD